MNVSLRPHIALLATVVLLLSTPWAAACPFCDGGPGGVNGVQGEVFGRDFWRHLLAAAAPFGVVLGVVAAVLWTPARRPNRQGRTND